MFEFHTHDVPVRFTTSVHVFASSVETETFSHARFQRRPVDIFNVELVSSLSAKGLIKKVRQLLYPHIKVEIKIVEKSLC